MKTEISNTYWVKIYMAGDFDHAKQILRTYLFDNPGCVNIFKTDYIYSGGEECGFVVEFINYPKFPHDEYYWNYQATACSNYLMEKLGQRTCTVMSPTESIRYVRKEYNG
jgi:hypothetical protein